MDTDVYPVLLPASLTDQEYEAVKAKASFSEWGDWWSLSVGDVMAALDCGTSKAARIRAQGLARLRREYPHGIPKPDQRQRAQAEPEIS